MQRWFILLGLMLLFGLWTIVMAYKDFKEAEIDFAEQSLAIATEKAGLVSIETADYYTGDGGYHVFIGKNNLDEDIVVWIQEGEIWQEKMSGGINAEHIIAKFKDAEIKRITLGLMTIEEKEKKQPIWEVFVKTSQGDYYYEMFDFKTGKRIARIQL